MKSAQQSIIDIHAGKYVEMDIATAYEVICKTQSLGTDWDIFLENAPKAVLHTAFQPCINIRQLRDFVLRELERPTPREENLPLADRISNSFDLASIYLQRYNIKVRESKGCVFICRTPTENDFDRARSVILYVLESFRLLAKGEKIVTNSQTPDVTMTVRGVELFFDIEIHSGIHKKAWVGFDFR